MTVHEMPQINFTGEEFAKVTQRVASETLRPDGYKDTICRIGVGQDPDGQSKNVDYVLALDGDDLRPRLATIGIERVEDSDRAHLIIHAERDTLTQDPALLGVVCQAAMEHAGVERVFLNPERDSDIPAATLKQAGAIALSENDFEWRLAA